MHLHAFLAGLFVSESLQSILMVEVGILEVACVPSLSRKRKLVSELLVRSMERPRPVKDYLEL